MFSRLFGILLVALLLASGCSRSDRERSEILHALATRADALNSRDMPQYISVVSSHYSDKGKDFAQLKENLGENFRDFEQFSYEAGTPSVTVAGNSAESVGSYRMKVRVRGKDMTLNGVERLRLVKEPEGWKIIAGI